MTKLKDPHRYDRKIFRSASTDEAYVFFFVRRFAEFIEGSPHLRDDEILDYETSHIRDDTDSDIATDDDSDIDNEDEC